MDGPKYVDANIFSNPPTKTEKLAQAFVIFLDVFRVKLFKKCAQFFLRKRVCHCPPGPKIYLNVLKQNYHF